MLTKNINLINFKKKLNINKVKKQLNLLSKEENQIIKSLGKFYKYSYKSKQIQKFKKNSNYRIIGMGGSSLGARAIYDFLKNKINKNFQFIDNLNAYYSVALKKKRLSMLKYAASNGKGG